MMRNRVVALLLAVCLLFFAGCREKTSTDKYFKYPIDSDPACIDPQIAATRSALMTIEACMEGLVRLDENGAIVPGIARRWDISDDGLVYTFYLQKDAVWYVPKALEKLLDKDFDRTLDADDFVFALTRAVDPVTKAPDAKKLYAVRNAKKIAQGELDVSMLGVNAIDSHTLRISLEYANPDFLRTLAGAVAMPCNREFFVFTGGRYGLDATMFLSNGPFYLSKWTQDTSLFLRRNETYSGDTPAVPSTLSLYVNTDEQKRIENLLEGVYDAIPVSIKNLDRVKQEGIHLQSYADITWILGLNQIDRTLANEKIRKALLLALEQDHLAAQGYPVTAEGLVPPALTVGTGSFRQMAGKAQRLSFHRDEAVKLLEEGLQELELKRLENLTLLCPDDLEIKRMMGYIIQYWQKNLNVYVNLEAVPEEEMQARLLTGEYQIAYFALAAETDDMTDYFRRFIGGNAKNLLGFDTPEFNDLVDQMDTCTDVAARQDLFKQAEKMLLQRAVAYPFSFEETYYATGKGVSGVAFYPYGGNVSFTKAEKWE